ncbi:MAG: hypothetical protein FWD60_09110 [Candidatus Azobacteroides sp.]|nr:hypothetical protein [Candidatus Azobacteroides sp.]
MTIGQKYLYINDITWHCFSVFYARKNIAALLNAINDFYEINKNYLTHLSFYFSNQQGERINLVFISEKQHSEKLVAFIEEYFERFLKEHPSESLYPIPYGSIIWLPYPNNSLIWNGFHIPRFLFESREVRDFSQATSLLIANLYDTESSYNENVISIEMFLSVQLWKQQNTTLPITTNPELAETLQSYWEYEDEDLLATWRQQAKIDNGTFIIRSHLDLSGFLNFKL